MTAADTALNGGAKKDVIPPFDFLVSNIYTLYKPKYLNLGIFVSGTGKLFFFSF